MRITRIGVATFIVLASCGGGDETPVEPVSSTTTVLDDGGLDDLFQEVETEDQVSESVDGSGVEPPVRNPATSEPVVSEAPASEAPASDPPSTDPVTGGSDSELDGRDQPAVTDPGTAVAPPDSGTVGSSAVFPGNSGFRSVPEGIESQMSVEVR